MSQLNRDIKRLEAEAEALRTPTERFTGVSDLRRLRRQHRSELATIRANAATNEFRAMSQWLLLLMLLVYVAADFGRDYGLVTESTYTKILIVMVSGAVIFAVSLSVQTVRLSVRNRATRQAQEKHRDALLEYLRSRQ